MKIQRNKIFLAGLIAFFTFCSLSAYSETQPGEKRWAGGYTYVNPFSRKPATPDEHWAYTYSLLKEGKVSAACKQLQIFVKRWPADPRNITAQRGVGDLYYTQGKLKKAFDAYETLIQKYYTTIPDYDAVLEKQLVIANTEMERKRMSWLFGGYTAPERAIPYYESIIRNAPQWKRAPELQYQIGEAYRKNGNPGKAVAAYTTVEYRYPESPIAEKAAFAKIESLREMVRKTPVSLDLRERAALAADMFKENYPNSEYRAEVDAFGQALFTTSAQATYEVGAFYERIHKAPRNDSARIYYEKIVEQYGGTEYAKTANQRLSVLLPEGLVPLPLNIVPESGGVFASAVAQGDGSGGWVADSTQELAPLPERLSTDTNAVEVTADRMEYVGDLLIADGSVAIQQEGASLRAQHASVDQETGEIIATGNVLMLHDGMVWEGEKLVYNFKTRQGDFGESTMYFEPVYITAEESERLSETEVLMRRAIITTCEGDNPAIYVKTDEVRVTEYPDEDGGTFIEAKKVTFYLKDVPVFYLPVWKRHLGYRMFTFTLGYGGRNGGFFLGRMALRPTDWLHSDTHLDYYTERGVGLGQDFFWEIREGAGNTVKTNGNGYIETYYINDRNPYASAKTPAEEALINPGRYRIKIGHRHTMTDETYFASKINYLSDPLILRDFFPEEYRDNANPENYAVIQHANDQYAASLRADHRLNDFYTTLNRFPELGFDWYRSQVKESKYYFESESTMAFLEMQHGGGSNVTSGVGTNMPPPQPLDYNSFRLDTYNKVLLPFRVDEFYNIIPRAAYRGTWYGNTVSGSAELRHIFEFGTLATLKAYKTLTESSGFYGDGLRHIFEPYADYSYRFDPNLSPKELYQFDEIETLDKENVIRFGMRNFIQTQRGESRIANFLDADLFTSLRLEKEGNEEDIGPLEGDMELSLTDYFNIQADFEYDWYESEFKDFNARFRLMTEDMSEYGFEYRFLNGKRTLYSPYARIFPNDKWSYEFYLQYDSQNGKWYDRQFVVNHKFDCVSMGLGMDIDSDDELTLWFMFWLNAFPKSSMNLAY